MPKTPVSRNQMRCEKAAALCYKTGSNNIRLHAHIKLKRGYKVREIEYKRQQANLHGDFTVPSSLRKTQCLHQILPPGATSLLPSKVTKQLLSLVNKHT